MSVKVKTVLADAGKGEIWIELKASRALPMVGVITSLDQKLVPPDTDSDPSIVLWRLPAENQTYVLYGIVTPTTNLFFAPSYKRVVSQEGAILPGGEISSFATRKLNAGEWVGPPEVISVKIR